MTNIDSTTLADLETQIEKLSAEGNRLRAAVKRLFPDVEAKVETVKDAKVDVFGEEPTLTTPGGVRQQVDTIPFKRELARRYANTIRLFEIALLERDVNPVTLEKIEPRTSLASRNE